MQAPLVNPAMPFPARLEGHLDRPSRWLWLIKWLLVLPHYLILAFLWIAFILLSLVAFVALLFGGRYPRGIFDFNVGVLRWTWRVGFYAFAANGTDRYPPFTLADVPDYPARLEIAYPERQRHGFPLIGRWLLGIPQYLIAGVFAGGAGGLGWNVTHHWRSAPGWGGLIDLLVFVAVVLLLFRGEYPRSIFDLVLGLNRWVLRVGAYAALLTHEYPPFRLDVGENDPGGLVIAAPPPGAPLARQRAREWTGKRVVGVVIGSLIALAGFAAVAGGGTATVLDQTQRDSHGYLMTGTETYSTNAYAVVSDSYRAGAAGDLFVARDILGTIRIRSESARPVFIGIGRAKAVDSYLGTVRRENVNRFGASRSNSTVEGGAPAAPPTAKHFWVARASGAGEQTLDWKPQNGDWRIVLMNANGTAGIHADVAAGASFPHLLAIGLALLGGGVLLLLMGAGVVYLAVRERRR